MNVAVCIATYKRPSLLRALLQSLERLTFVNVEQPVISIVVIDNDWRGSAARVISDFPSYRHKLLYRVETTPGISYARNAGIKAATTSDFVAFLDDDEEASPQWLEELLTVQHAFRSPIAAGPIVPTYATPPPAWVPAGQFHQRKRYSTGTRVTSTSAGNCLISREVLSATGPCWFDPSFALTGGEDTHFFRRCARLGFPITWADDALVYEHVPESRFTPDYLVTRARNGGNHWTRTELALECGRVQLALRAAAGIVRVAQGCACTAMAPMLSPSQRLRGRLLLAEGLGNLDAFRGRRYDVYRANNS